MADSSPTKTILKHKVPIKNSLKTDPSQLTFISSLILISSPFINSSSDLKDTRRMGGMSMSCCGGGGGGGDDGSSLLTHLVLIIVICLSVMAVCTSNERRTAVRVVRCRWPTGINHLYIRSHLYKRFLRILFIYVCMCWFLISDDELRRYMVFVFFLAKLYMDQNN